MVKLATPEQAAVKKATRAAFGATLAELAGEGVPVVAVDADLTGSTTLNKFAAADPAYADRLFNCGIAEQNMIDVAAGLALTGKIAYTYFLIESKAEWAKRHEWDSTYSDWLSANAALIKEDYTHDF